MNPNVYYELGVRHALNKYTTLVIRKNSNQPPPFNISGLNVLGYDSDDDEKIKASRQIIGEYVKNGLEKQSVDSLVHEYLDDIKVERKPKPIAKKEIILHPLKNVKGKEIGLITGDLQNIKEVDVWVNSENTNMLMARHYERSISGTIRYMGAKKDKAKRVSDDVIANELHDIVGNSDVPAGAVVPTGAGELTRTNNVKKIFHAAAVKGQVGRGYSPISDIAECVRNALELADQEDMASEDLHSILFPLMGTGTSKMDAEIVAKDLIQTALSYLEENKESKINKVFFLAFNEQDREICEHIYSTFIKENRLGEATLTASE
jgi:O-acetyl-ADP-ribose deacetylase (regulator of RNase III)